MFMCSYFAPEATQPFCILGGHMVDMEHRSMLRPSRAAWSPVVPHGCILIEFLYWMPHSAGRWSGCYIAGAETVGRFSVADAFTVAITEAQCSWERFVRMVQDTRANRDETRGSLVQAQCVAH
jgi:hypothetical protein